MSLHTKDDWNWQNKKELDSQIKLQLARQIIICWKPPADLILVLIGRFIIVFSLTQRYKTMEDRKQKNKMVNPSVNHKIGLLFYRCWNSSANAYDVILYKMQACILGFKTAICFIEVHHFHFNGFEILHRW